MARLADVLLVTVNSHEREALRTAFEAATGKTASPESVGDKVYYNLGSFQGVRFFHALSQMGSEPRGGMRDTVDDAIRILEPIAVIAVGIAFGVDKEKQQIGDILISKQIHCSEPKRFGRTAISRGDTVTASPQLLNFFLEFAQAGWNKRPVEQGLILSSEKLIDNETFRNQLLEQFPEAIGGEMEGAGLYYACVRHNVQWILIKAICDWADGNKGQNKSENQQTAAKSAAQFLVHSFQCATVPIARNDTERDLLVSPGKWRAQVPKYAWISFGAFLCFLVLLSLLIVNIDKLSQFGLLQPIYYLVLILMGATSAAFVFGVLPSTATFTGRALGGTLRFSGPVVAVALVVIGGYYFLPRTTSFFITVYVHGEAGQQDVVLRNEGQVFLKLGPEIRSEHIGQNGQAIFPRIPTDFRGQQVAGWVESDDYEASSQTVTLAGNYVDLIVKKKIKRFKLAGIVFDEHGRPLPDVHIILPEYHCAYITKSDGAFEFDIRADHEQQVELVAQREGYRSMRLSPTLGDTGVSFSLKR
jgi:nucleoside phosphorylase